MTVGKEAKSRFSPSGNYLCFTLDGQAYGAPVESIREVARIPAVSPLPQAMPYVAGVISLRGSIIPVVDLRLRLGLPAAPYAKNTCVVILGSASGSQGGPVGLIVDAVNDVASFTRDQIDPAPQLGDAVKISTLAGLGKKNDRVVLILDLGAIFPSHSNGRAA